MRVPSALSTVGAVLMVTALVWPARGQAPDALYDFEGVWRYADGNEGARRIERAVSRAVDDMPFFLAPIARDRVLARTYVNHRIELVVRGPRVFMSADRWGPVASLVGGPAVSIVGPEGDELQFSQRFVSGRLVQRFDHPDARRENTFALSGDGEWLWLGVVISSPRLPDEAVYRLRYRRGGSVRQASIDGRGDRRVN